MTRRDPWLHKDKMIASDYYLLGTAILLFVAAVWSPAKTIETKAEKYKRLEEICIHDGARSTRMPVSAIGAAGQPIP